MVAHVFGNQTTCLEKTIAPGKLCHVNRDVMAIILAQRLGRLAKDQRLGTADAYFSSRAGPIRLQRRRRAEHGLVEPYGLTAAAPLHMLRRLEPSEAYPPCLLSRSCRLGCEGRAPGSGGYPSHSSTRLHLRLSAKESELSAEHTFLKTRPQKPETDYLPHCSKAILLADVLVGNVSSSLVSGALSWPLRVR